MRKRRTRTTTAVFCRRLRRRPPGRPCIRPCPAASPPPSGGSAPRPRTHTPSLASGWPRSRSRRPEVALRCAPRRRMWCLHTSLPPRARRTAQSGREQAGEDGAARERQRRPLTTVASPRSGRNKSVPVKPVVLELWADQAALNAHAQVNITRPPNPVLATLRADDTRPREDYV